MLYSFVKHLKFRIQWNLVLSITIIVLFLHFNSFWHNTQINISASILFNLITVKINEIRINL